MSVSEGCGGCGRSLRLGSESGTDVVGMLLRLLIAGGTALRQQTQSASRAKARCVTAGTIWPAAWGRFT